MVQASEERLGDDAANSPDAARNRRILAQRQVRASLVVIPLIQGEQVTKVPLAKHNDMIQAFPPDRADQHSYFAMASEPRSAGPSGCRPAGRGWGQDRA
jgi:hypothetical protein